METVKGGLSTSHLFWGTALLSMTREISCHSQPFSGARLWDVSCLDSKFLG